MLLITNLPTRRMKLPPTNPNPRTIQTNASPRIHVIKRNAWKIPIQQLPSFLLSRKRQTTQLHPMLLTDLRNTKNPLRHNERHTHISMMQNLHNLLKLTVITKNVNRTTPKPLLNHRNKQFLNIQLEGTPKRGTPISRFHNKNITVQQRRRPVKLKVPSISNPVAAIALNQNLSRTQNVVRLNKRNMLITILDCFTVTKRFNRPASKRKLPIHN